MMKIQKIQKIQNDTYSRGILSSNPCLKNSVFTNLVPDFIVQIN